MLTFGPRVDRVFGQWLKWQCVAGGGSASEVETHKNIDSVLHTKTTFQAHSTFSVSIQK